MSKELTQQLIGRVLSSSLVNRDAIHVAVAPVIAGELLKPGQHISLKGADTAVASGTHIGIVDPFLEDRFVEEGERFWMFLYPNTVTSLRHEWQHPAFTPEVAESKRWLQEFAEDNETDYDTLLEMVANKSVHFGSTHWQDTFFGGDGKAEFWTHYENVTGTRVSAAVREKTSFLCAC